MTSSLIAALALTAAGGAAAQSWWKPTADSTWQWQLSGAVDTSHDVDVYDIDLFNSPSDLIATLKSQGRRVLCYFSAGSAESFRADFGAFLPGDMGLPLDGFPDERWVDTRSDNVRAIMLQRLDLAADKGCDGVEPDNVDGYANPTGFPLTGSTQLDFNTFLANAAHARGLAVALKNDVGQLQQLEPFFDMAVNEQCNQYRECGGYAVFTSKNKPVFNAEYAKKYRNDTRGARTKMCRKMIEANIRTLVLDIDLDDSYRFSCDAAAP